MRTPTRAIAALPVPLDAKSVTAYFRGPPRDARHARFRHLTALAAIGWWANQVNDQACVPTSISTSACWRIVTRLTPAAFRQAARCARAHLVDANLELERYATVDRVADNLAKLYPADPPANSIEDWPLLLALRSVSIEPRSRTAIALLATRATTIAGSTIRANQGERSSRLLAATSRGLMTLGEAAKARELALQSLILTGKPPTARAAWLAMPVRTTPRWRRTARRMRRTSRSCCDRTSRSGAQRPAAGVRIAAAPVVGCGNGSNTTTWAGSRARRSRCWVACAPGVTELATPRPLPVREFQVGCRIMRRW